MFIAIYEFTVKPGQTQAFEAAWLALTQGIYRHCGSLGSRLHSTGTDLMVAYAQWPDRADWLAAQDVELDPAAQAASAAMHACLTSSRTAHELEVTSDYLRAAPHGGGLA
ncbi:MAG: antibiotic biosynthesis monooxygenase [Planctomycetes bacterium]|nr:antibiotic biosynthesis monooxygenase [Planctomycetota bacterium]